MRMGLIANSPEVIQQTDRLLMLNEISRVLSSTLDLGVLYETIYQQVGRVTGTTVFYIALRRQDDTIALPYFREMGELYLDVEVPSGPSVTRLVLERGTPLLFCTNSEYEACCHENGVPGIEIGDREKMPETSQSMVYVPLNTGSRTIGILSVQSIRENAYSEEDVHALGIIASQAAVAIENARLYAESQGAVQQMEVLLRVAQTISGSLDLRTVLDAILASMGEVVSYYSAEILLPDYANGRLKLVGNVGCLAELRSESGGMPFGEGITGKVFATGEPLIIPDVTQVPEYFRDYEEIRSEMAVPLKQGEEVVGVLNVEQTKFAAFSAKDLDLLSLFASQAAIAIENARLYTELQSRVIELQTIQSIVQKLTTLHDVSAMAALLDAELRQLIEYHSCRLFVLDADEETLVMVGGAEGSDPLRTRLGQGVSGWIAEHGDSVMIPNALEDGRAYYLDETPVPVSVMGAPLTYEGKVHGVIMLTQVGVNRFDENQLRLLEILAAQTAIALDRARLYLELRTEAVTDPLTQLYNRRYLAKRFHEEKARAERNMHMLAAIMVDIDKFKQVNDTFGHDAGDVVLQDIAVVLRAVVRTGDIVARYGGEEFCVLLTEVSGEEATSVAKRLRFLIERRQLPEAAGARTVTASMGLALLEPGSDDEDLFSRADLAMYEVKRRGGNAVGILQNGDLAFYGSAAATGS